MRLRYTFLKLEFRIQFLSVTHPLALVGRKKKTLHTGCNNLAWLSATASNRVDVATDLFSKSERSIEGRS